MRLLRMFFVFDVVKSLPMLGIGIQNIGYASHKLYRGSQGASWKYIMSSCHITPQMAVKLSSV